MEFNDTQSIDTIVQSDLKETRMKKYSEEELNEWKEWAESWIHDVDSNKD
jgi:hypothetical protein